MSLDAFAHQIKERCETLASYSEEPDRITRRFATVALKRVNELVGNWMRAAGMVVRIDAIGNIIGRYEGGEPGGKTLLLGSHLDTVCDAGKYDGILGVMIALSCVERLFQRHERLPFAIEVVGFTDEEGARYPTTYLGSQAATGIFDEAVLALRDDEGVSLRDALIQMGRELDLQALQTPNWRKDDLLGYFEVHIEQGPVLEAKGIPVGIVTAISGQNRYTLTLQGRAGHAGTVPMGLRRDALCAAAQCIVAIEESAQVRPGLVATVGKMITQPGASNVIPGKVEMTLDIRHPDNDQLEDACQIIYKQIQAICESRHIDLTWSIVKKDVTVPCSSHLQHVLVTAVEQAGWPIHYLPSGAGHDGVSLQALTEIAMLFVRCKEGISHNPREDVTPSDIAIALDICERFLYLLA